MSKHIPSPIQSRSFQGRVKDAPSRHWVYKILARPLWPYAQLARLDRPIGWQLLLWPCWWSLGLVIAKNGSGLALSSGDRVVWGWYLLLFLIGAIAMRGAGCTYNDLVDEDIDTQVERTRSRPLPSKQVSRGQAKLFLVLQALIGLVILVQFNFLTIMLGIASLLIVALYPFCKRITDWPQLFLGLAFSWGALLGWTAWEARLDWPPLLLYMAAICWTIGYDTIYAHQDREDDALVGVRSTARLFGHHTKLALVLLYGMMLVIMSASFIGTKVGLMAYGGLILGGLHLFYQILRLDINNPEQCLRLFRANFYVGLIIFIGLFLAGIESVVRFY